MPSVIPSPQSKPDIEEYLNSLKASKKFGPQVVCHRIFPAVDRKGSLNQPDFTPEIQQLLRTKGIDQLYTHQVKAISLLAQGKDLIVATPTASGKSMIYNLPILEQLLKDGFGHALYLFPLKALAQDQLRILQELRSMLPAEIQRRLVDCAAIFDGDSSAYQRRKIRDKVPAIVITNPDMLHLSMLPFHGSWSAFFHKLKYIVIDEVHTYRGVFGSHVAWVLRRLQRIAQYYGGNPTFSLFSATIGNPEDFGAKLIGRSLEVITQSGAAQAEKHFVFLNPWDSAATTASQLLEAAMKRGLRTIVYTKSRKMTELISMWTSPRLGHLTEKLSSYRAGFLPEERRDIEQKLSKGELLGVVSTSALELGIDIGDLDLCILVGYPGSIMASWQRGGRVGRQLQKSAIIMIGQEDALDQYYMRQPDDFFSRSPEAAVVNPFNEAIAQQHLHCLAAEIPISATEELAQKPEIRRILENLTGSGQLLQDADGKSWYASLKRPQRHVNLRGGGNQMTLIDCEKGEIFGEMDSGRALKECHSGAVYLHRAKSWVVSDLDIEGREVHCTQQKPPYFTRPVSTKNTEIIEVLCNKLVYGCPVSFGRVKVTEKVTGYQKLMNTTQKLISTTALELPEQIIETEGFWVEIPQEIQEKQESSNLHFMGAIHALEHVIISLFPLFVLCDRNDIGGISCPRHPQTNGAAIFVYDGHAGGVGLSAEAYRKIEDLLAEAEKTIQSCQCENGCPSCVHSPKCGSGNRPIDKAACQALLRDMRRNLSSGVPVLRGDRVVVEKSAGKDHSLPGKYAESKNIEKTQRKGRFLLPAHYGVFDLETKRSAAEVGGWHRSEEMGISVAVVYDSRLEDCVTYLEHEIDRLVKHLQQVDLIVGFNIRRFDYRVLSGYSPLHFNALPTLDLLEEVSNHLGYRLSLDRLAQHTLGIGKSADGLQALQWFKEGKIDLIAKYCRQDVEITRDLLYHALDNGFLLFQNKDGKIVRLPLALEKAFASHAHR